MSIEKMKLVKVTGNLNKMNAALTTCFEGGFFHPEHVSEKAGADSYHPFDAVNPYLPILAKLEQIGKDCGVDFTPKQKINRETVEVAATLLLGIEGKHLETRFGKLPTAQVAQFQEMSGSRFFFVPLIEKENDCWCIYSASHTNMERADELFAEAGFKKAWVPNFSNEDGIVSEFSFESEIRQLTEQKQLLLAAKERGSGALEQLSHMENLSVSLDDIFASKYLQVRFGRLPSDSYQKLKYYDDRLFFFQPLSEEGAFVWGFCFTDKIHVAEVDEILSSLFFERVWIPEYVHGVPGQTFEHLRGAVEEADRELEATDALIRETIDQNYDMCSILYATLQYLSRSFELRRHVSIHDSSFILVGFVPEKETAGLEKKLHELDPDLTVEISAHDSDKRFHSYVPFPARGIPFQP